MRKAEEDDDTETEDEEDDYSGPDGLINAIEDGKTKIAIDLIRNSNVDVNYTSEKEITALHAVVRRKKCDMGVLEALLDENPNVNAQDAGAGHRFTVPHSRNTKRLSKYYYVRARIPLQKTNKGTRRSKPSVDTITAH